MTKRTESSPPILAPDEKFLRLPSVMEKTGLSRTQLYREISAGTFPRGHTYKEKRVTFWLQSEVHAWQQEQMGLVVT